MNLRQIAWIWAIGLMVLVGLVGCQQPPEPQEYQDYTLNDICTTAKRDSYVKVRGVLKAPDTIIEQSRRYRVLLVEDTAQAQPWLGLWIPVGKGNNQTHPMPEKFTLADFKVQKQDGQVVGHGDTVIIWGRYGVSCEVYVDRIE
jgi:hypothetical protein